MRCDSLVYVALACLVAGGARAGGEGCEDGYRRAGNPEAIACWAAPSDTGHYEGYYVGGGLPCLGQSRHVWEGTWGWDYCGLLFPKRIMLKWSHGRCYQGGLGAYRTAGPRCTSTSSP